MGMASAKSATVVRTPPCTTGKLRILAASTMSLPMPGRAKMASTKTALDKQAADGHGEQRDSRQDGDAQRIGFDDAEFGKTEGARRANMIFAHDFEHRGPHDARQIADPAEAQREARHDQMQGLIA